MQGKSNSFLQITPFQPRSGILGSDYIAFPLDIVIRPPAIPPLPPSDCPGFLFIPTSWIDDIFYADEAEATAHILNTAGDDTNVGDCIVFSEIVGDIGSGNTFNNADFSPAEQLNITLQATRFNSGVLTVQTYMSLNLPAGSLVVGINGIWQADDPISGSFMVELLDCNWNPISSTTETLILTPGPTTVLLSIPVAIPSAGEYVIRFTSLLDSNSGGFETPNTINWDGTLTIDGNEFTANTIVALWGSAPNPSQLPCSSGE